MIHQRRALSIALERIRRPLSGRREIEFIVSGNSLACNENFAAGMLPQPVGDARHSRFRDADAIEIAEEKIGHRQRVSRRFANPYMDFAYRIPRVPGMTLQRNLLY